MTRQGRIADLGRHNLTVREALLLPSTGVADNSLWTRIIRHTATGRMQRASAPLPVPLNVRQWDPARDPSARRTALVRSPAGGALLVDRRVGGDYPTTANGSGGLRELSCCSE